MTPENNKLDFSNLNIIDPDKFTKRPENFELPESVRIIPDPRPFWLVTIQGNDEPESIAFEAKPPNYHVYLRKGKIPLDIHKTYDRGFVMLPDKTQNGASRDILVLLPKLKGISIPDIALNSSQLTPVGEIEIRITYDGFIITKTENYNNK
jgi:hypothetical protein